MSGYAVFSPNIGFNLFINLFSFHEHRFCVSSDLIDCRSHYSEFMLNFFHSKTEVT